MDADPGRETLPPDLPPFILGFCPTDMTTEECLRWLRIGNDLQTVLIGMNAISRPTNSAKLQDLSDLDVLQNQTDAALDRLSRDQDFLISLARKLGDADFEDGITKANVQDPQVLAPLRKKVSDEGGFLQLIEKRLGNMSSDFSAQRIRFKDRFDSLRNIGETGLPPGIVLVDETTIEITLPSTQCIVGAALIVHGTIGVGIGAVAVASGIAALPGVLAATAGGAEIGAGGVLVGQSC